MGSTVVGSGSVVGSTVVGSGSVVGSTVVGSGSVVGSTVVGTGGSGVSTVIVILAPAFVLKSKSLRSSWSLTVEPSSSTSKMQFLPLYTASRASPVGYICSTSEPKLCAQGLDVGLPSSSTELIANLML